MNVEEDLIRRDHAEVEAEVETDIRLVGDKREWRGNLKLNEEEEEDLIKTEIDPTEVEAEIETVDGERGGRGNLKLNEVLPTRAGRWRRVS